MDRNLHRELLTLASDPAVELDVLLRRVLRAALALGGTVTGDCETGLAILFDLAEVGLRPVVSAAAQQNGSVPLDLFVKRFNSAPGGRLSRMARTGRPELVPAHVEGADVGSITGNDRPSTWLSVRVIPTRTRDYASGAGIGSAKWVLKRGVVSSASLWALASRYPVYREMHRQCDVRAKRAKEEER